MKNTCYVYTYYYNNYCIYVRTHTQARVIDDEESFDDILMYQYRFSYRSSVIFTAMPPLLIKVGRALEITVWDEKNNRHDFNSVSVVIIALCYY